MLSCKEIIPKTIINQPAITGDKKMEDKNQAFIQAFKQMWGNYPDFVLLLDKNHVIVALNKFAEDLGIEPGINCFSLNQTDRMCRHCKAPLMRKEGKAQRVVNFYDGKGIIDGYWIPVEESDGLYVHFGNNITEWADSEKFLQIKKCADSDKKSS